jgi:hypothetical protein
MLYVGHSQRRLTFTELHGQAIGTVSLGPCRHFVFILDSIRHLSARRFDLFCD